MPFSCGRVLFVGDSITHNGLYVDYAEAWMRAFSPGFEAQILRAGLSAETLSGLTEPFHAYPRPHLFDRLDAVLALAKPDLVVSCYGVNDGIYHPFATERFAAYQGGVQRLKQQVRAFGADLCLLTPTWYDRLARENANIPKLCIDYSFADPYPGYGMVMEAYADWLLRQKDDHTKTVDMLRPLKALAQSSALRERGDGVHPPADGHWVMAKAVLAGLFGQEVQSTPWFALDSQDAYLLALRQKNDRTAAALRKQGGHRHPGYLDEPALPLEEALALGQQDLDAALALLGGKK